MLIVLAIYVSENSGKFHQGGRKGPINQNFVCIWTMNVFAGVGFHWEGWQRYDRERDVSKQKTLLFACVRVA